MNNIIKIFGITVIVLLLIVYKGLNAQENVEKEFYRHYIKGDMVGWQKTLADMKLNYLRNPDNKKLHNIVKAQYGLIAYFIGVEEKKQAANELEIANKNLKLLLQVYPNNMIYKAWQSAFLGFEMGISNYKAIYLGPQSQLLIIDALKNGKYVPEVNLEYANMRFWAPAIVGGDKEQSLIYYRKTIVLLEARKRTQEWYYLWALTAYANAYKALNESEKAISVYEKILKLEPDYTWVAQELIKTKKALPNLNL